MDTHKYRFRVTLGHEVTLTKTVATVSKATQKRSLTLVTPVHMSTLGHSLMPGHSWATLTKATTTASQVTQTHSPQLIMGHKGTLGHK